MQWVASTLHTTSEHGVSSITTADAHTSAASSRLNWRPPADLNGLANAVGSQYSSHYLGTRYIQHYYRWCRTPRLPAVDWTDAPRRFKWTRPFRAKDKIWFLRVCHHISTGLYISYIQFMCISQNYNLPFIPKVYQILFLTSWMFENRVLTEINGQ